MRYETPTVKSVKIEDVLSKLGPARALMYVPEKPGNPTTGSSVSTTNHGGVAGVDSD